MEVKPYDIAFYMGRFQPLHIGHCEVINTALKICDRVLILVGSANEVGTKDNPFDISTRMNIIKEIYGDKVIIKPLNDLTDKSDTSSNWTKYLLSRVKEYIGKLPDLTIFGDEKSNGWFSDDEMKDTMRTVMPRNRVKISATEIRAFLVKNDKENFMKFTNPKTHKHFDALRGQLLSTEPYKIAFENLVRQNKKLKGWSDYDTRDIKLEGDLIFEGQNWD